MPLIRWGIIIFSIQHFIAPALDLMPRGGFAKRSFVNSSYPGTVKASSGHKSNYPYYTRREKLLPQYALLMAPLKGN